MCGIVGLFLKDPKLEPHLGAMLTDMLITMTDRGPDSAGIAIYGGAKDGLGKITIQSATPDEDFKNLDGELHDAIGQPVTMLVKSTHAVIEVPLGQLAAARSALAHLRPAVKVMSAGDSIEIFKEVGLPKDVAARFEVSKMTGTHGIGHTRMATESAVTTMGAHPFSTGPDQCLVHNGSLSNHNGLRRELIRLGKTPPPMSAGSSRRARALVRLSNPVWRIWTASTPSLSAPITALASSATPSPASLPSWPKPTSMSLSGRNTGRL